MYGVCNSNYQILLLWQKRDIYFKPFSALNHLQSRDCLLPGNLTIAPCVVLVLIFDQSILRNLANLVGHFSCEFSLFEISTVVICNSGYVPLWEFDVKTSSAVS